MKNKFYLLENEKFSVELEAETLCVRIQDKATEKIWQTNGLIQMRYGYYIFNLAEHCSFEINVTVGKLNIAFQNMDFRTRFKGHGYKKPENGPDLKFSADIILNENNITFRLDKIENMDDEECHLSFPHGLMKFDSNENMRLIFPHGYGMIYEFPREDYFLLKERYGCFGFTMPFYGILQWKYGLCAYIKTPFDCEAAIDINSVKKGTSNADISFIYNREKANYLREIAIYPLGGNADYTAFAKLYRKILMEENRFVSLNEKIKTNPEVEKLVGAVIMET